MLPSAPDLGDCRSEQSWFDAFDVVGGIGRSAGGSSCPFLIEAGEASCGAILTACLLSIVD